MGSFQRGICHAQDDFKDDHFQSPHVDTVIVDGRVVVNDGRLTLADGDAIVAEAQAVANTLWARAGRQTIG